MICSLLLMFLLGTATASHLEGLNIPFKFGFCERPPVTSGLESDKFFKNKWYNWKTSGTFFLGTSASCSGMDSKVDGETINLLHYQYEALLNRYILLRGKTEKIFTSFKGLVFPVEYQVFHKFGFTIPISIVDTDYENWAVMYFCKQQFLSKIEMIWVLVRDKDASPEWNQLDQIRTSLAALDTSLEDLEAQDNSECGEQEPHL